MNSGGLYRQKALERVTSPEQLNSYIKVSSPGVWFMLVAILLVLLAGFYWAFTGTLEVRVDTRAVTIDGATYCWLPANDIVNLKPGMTVRLGNDLGKVTEIDSEHSDYDQIMNIAKDLGIRTPDILLNDRLYRVTMKVSGASNGVEDVAIIIETVRPADMLLK